MEREFYLIVSPGLESLALNELEHRAIERGWALDQKQLTKGGISFCSTMATAFEMQYDLRLPTRLLLRLANFRCRDLPKLFQKMIAIPWRHYIQGEDFIVKVSTHQSRLMQSKKISQTVEEAIAKSLEQQAPKKREKPQKAQMIFIRFENDQATISIDCTGLALYEKEGPKSGHRAALKENYACAALWALKNQSEKLENVELYDPMCGSGTFAKCALEYHLPRKRVFAWEFWSPSFLKQELKDKGRLSSALAPLWPNLSVAGSDLNLKYLDPSLKDYDFQEGDASKLLIPGPQKKASRLLISNPPYGERLSKKISVQELLDIYQKLSPEMMALVFPRSWDLRTAALGDYRPLEVYPFKNAGIAVNLWLLVKES